MWLLVNFTCIYNILKTKIKIGKICNMKIKTFFYKKKKYLVFKKPFSKRYILKKGGRLIIRVVLYSGQYGDIISYKRCLHVGWTTQLWFGRQEFLISLGRNAYIKA